MRNSPDPRAPASSSPPRSACWTSATVAGGNRDGRILPLGAITKTNLTSGPDRVMHYNGYPTIDTTGGPAPTPVFYVVIRKLVGKLGTATARTRVTDRAVTTSA